MVDHVEEEGMVHGDQQVDLSWYLDRLDQMSSPIKLDYQYQPIGSGEGVDIYVLDSGINRDHMEFERRAKSVYDAVDNHYTNLPKQNGRDCHGHGTHVASLAGGVRYGAAKKANIMSVRVLNCNNAAPWSVVLEGLDHIAGVIPARRKPAVVSMSLGGRSQPAADEAVNKLQLMGIPVVVSAGNDRGDACHRSPAGAAGAITVSATNISDGLYYGSSMGECVDLFAPGNRILAAGHHCNNCTRRLSGTSMAAPLVSGVLAVYLQREPYLSVDDLLQRLINDSLKDVISFEGARLPLAAVTPNRLLQVPGKCAPRQLTHYYLN